MCVFTQPLYINKIMTKACHCSCTNTDILKLQNDNFTKQITIQFWNTETKTLLVFYKRYPGYVSGIDFVLYETVYHLPPQCSCFLVQNK